MKQMIIAGRSLAVDAISFIRRGVFIMKPAVMTNVVIVLVGCSGNPADDRYIHYGQVKGEQVRIPPCNPFYADELIDWATELDSDSRHDRSARVIVDADGRVRCSSKEYGSSGFYR